MIATLFLFAIAVAGAGATYGWVLSLTSSQSQQAGTQIRVELVQWDLENNKAVITVRNTGSIEAIIDSVEIKTRSESNFIAETDDLPTLDVGVKNEIVWDEGQLEENTAYVVRVRCTTGFYYEIIETTPSTN